MGKPTTLVVGGCQEAYKLVLVDENGIVIDENFRTIETRSQLEIGEIIPGNETQVPYANKIYRITKIDGFTAYIMLITNRWAWKK